MAPARLVLLREAHDLSQHALAEAIGVTRVYISQLETGKKHPSEAVLTKLCAYFRVEVAVLFLPPHPCAHTERTA